MMFGAALLVLAAASHAHAAPQLLRPAGLKYNAWFGTHGSKGAFLGNATDAARAGYRQFAGGAIAMAAALDAVAGGPVVLVCINI